MAVKLPTTPSPARATRAWVEEFAADVKKAAGSSGRLTRRKAEAMTGLFADNVKNYFDKTGRSWAKVETVIASGEQYAAKNISAAAGTDNKLSLKDIRLLPKDMVDDLLVMRGKQPIAAATGDTTAPPSMTELQNAVSATNVSSIVDWGKGIDLTRYPAGTDRDKIFCDITGFDSWDDVDFSEMFDVTRGADGVREFAGKLCEVGDEEKEFRDEDDLGPDELTGDQVKKLFDDVASAAEAFFLPVSRFDSVELARHSIEEDGDTEHLILFAKEKNGDLLVLNYQDFPF